MNNYRERLESTGLLTAFEQARRARDAVAIENILKAANFSPLEIESILWAKGDIGTAPTGGDKRKRMWDEIIGRIGIAMISGVILGGVFAYASSGLSSTVEPSETLMADYRSPQEAYYRPFVWGFAIGAIGGLVTGALLYEPSFKKPRWMK